MVKANGWVRLGIVATVLWIIGSFVYVSRQTEREGRMWIHEFINTCPNGDQAMSDKCADEGVAAAKAATAPSIIWGETAILSSMVIPGWLSVIVVLWVIRWVRRGFVKKLVRGDSDLEFRGMRTW